MAAPLPRLDSDGRRLKVAHDEEPSGRVGQDLSRLLNDDEGADRPVPQQKHNETTIYFLVK